MKRDPAKAPEPWTWEDIFPQMATKAEAQDEDAMLAAMEMWTHHRPRG